MGTWPESKLTASVQVVAILLLPVENIRQPAKIVPPDYLALQALFRFYDIFCYLKISRTFLHSLPDYVSLS